MSFKTILLNDLLKELDNHKFEYLHIHHTWKPTHKSFNGTNHLIMQQSMRFHHVEDNKWSDIGQHLSLFPDGLFVTGRPFNRNPASISGFNKGALSVEMIGNFDKEGTGVFNNLGYDKLEGLQKDNILKLMNYFGEKYGYEKIIFHNEHSNKSCPGNSLNKKEMIDEAKKIYLKDNEKQISKWFVESFKWGTDLGLVDGTNPKNVVTREMLIEILYRYDRLRGNS